MAASEENTFARLSAAARRKGRSAAGRAVLVVQSQLEGMQQIVGCLPVAQRLQQA